MLGTALTMAHRAVNQADWFLLRQRGTGCVDATKMNQPIHILIITCSCSYFQLCVRQVDLHFWFLWSHYRLFDITPGSRTTPREPSLCSHLTPSRRMFGYTHSSTVGATRATAMGLWTQAFSRAKKTPWIGRVVTTVVLLKLWLQDNQLF